MDPPNGQKSCDLCTNREIEQRSKLVSRDRMKEPPNRDQADPDKYYAKYPSLRLSVESGESWQDRGILDAFL